MTDLVARPGTSSVLPARARRALAEHISSHGCYPAVIVRPLPGRPGKYEILDGHHRVEVLRDLGQGTARCEVWPVGREQADVLAATLNRLRGRQRPDQRARQVRRLVRRLGREGAAASLGITPRGLQQQLAASQSPRQLRNPPALDLQAVVFHVSGDEAERLRGELRRAGLGEVSRREALLRLLDQAATGNARSGAAKEGRSG